MVETKTVDLMGVDKLETAWKVHGWRYQLTPTFIRSKAPRTILDVGCNNGLMASQISQQFPSSIVLACDRSNGIVGLANQVFKQNNLNALAFCSDVEEMLKAFQYCRFDVIVVTEFLEHIGSSLSRYVASKLQSMGKELLVSVPYRSAIPAPGHLHEFDHGKLESYFPNSEIIYNDLHNNHICISVFPRSN